MPGQQPLRSRPESAEAAGPNLCVRQGTPHGPPASVYVSLDTLRDQLFVDEASRLVADGLGRLVLPGVRPGETSVEILASHWADTIGACRAILKRRPLMLLGASPFAKAQAHHLRLKSVVWSELDAHPVTPLRRALTTRCRRYDDWPFGSALKPFEAGPPIGPVRRVVTVLPHFGILGCVFAGHRPPEFKE